MSKRELYENYIAQLYKKITKKVLSTKTILLVGDIDDYNDDGIETEMFNYYVSTVDYKTLEKRLIDEEVLIDTTKLSDVEKYESEKLYAKHGELENLSRYGLTGSHELDKYDCRFELFKPNLIVKVFDEFVIGNPKLFDLVYLHTTDGYIYEWCSNQENNQKIYNMDTILINPELKNN